MRFGLCFLLGAWLGSAVVGETNPPVVLLHAPLLLREGATNQVYVRGQYLLAITNAVSPAEGVLVQFNGVKESKPPDGQDAKKVGDQRVDLAVFVPDHVEYETVQIVFSSTNGMTATNLLALYGSGELIDETEPNNGFKSAQQIASGSTVRATLDPKRDVDVYAFSASQGETIRLELRARSLGSAADTLLTVFSADGYWVAANDDASGRDAALSFTPKTAGRYFLVVQDANDRGGDTHPYILTIGSDPPTEP